MIACVIPARLNSSRFPGKLLAAAGGKTVLRRTYECALRSKKIEKLFVATDSAQIADHVQAFGGAVVWTSSNCASGTDRIAEAIQVEAALKDASIVVNLQGDHPLTLPATLDSIVELLASDPSASMATAARPLQSWEEYCSPHSVKCVIDCFNNALYFSRSPIPYVKARDALPPGYLHIGLYGYRASFLQLLGTLPNSDLQRSEDLEQLKVLELGYRIKVAIVDDPALGIDTPEDLEKLKNLLQNYITQQSTARVYPK
jgi:3-deoxy-manno-octulosonate cytidylyltransferase (CMP-KDO synthetase)